jgi:hypothetical protein
MQTAEYILYVKEEIDNKLYFTDIQGFYYLFIKSVD